MLDPSSSAKFIFVLYYRIGDNVIRLKLIKKGVREMEDRERLVVDKSDGTSLADFECIYLQNVKGKIDDKLDKVSCVFATNGPYVYKVIYQRNFYAGLIFKDRQRYEIFADNYPIKVAMNTKYFAVLTKRASDDRPRILVYRDVAKNGSKYLYCGLKLDHYDDTLKELTHMPAKDIDFKITDDDVLLVTTNKGSSLVKKFQLADLEVVVKNTEELDNFDKNVLIFNEDSDYQNNVVPFKYLFVHLSMQKPLGTALGGSLFGWVMLISFVLATLVLAYLIRKNIIDTKNEIRDSGVDFEKEEKGDDYEEHDQLNMSDNFGPAMEL